MTIAAVELINVTDGLVILKSGAVVKIETMLDADGNRTSDPKECEIAICELPNGQWASFCLWEYEHVRSH